METRAEYDVVQISDFRLPGGTTSSIAEEVRAQSQAGLSTAVMHAAGSVTGYPIPWSTHIRRILDLPGVHVATPRDRLHAKVLVIRHPTVIWSTPSTFDHVTADEVVVVVNHAAIDGGGTQHYDVEATDRRVRSLFCRDPIWAPIGPVVRGTVLQQTQAVPLLETDWVNIFQMPAGSTTREGFVSSKPVIGRHSRPQPGKWPDTKEDILAAYPNSEGYDVQILGGAKIARRKIGWIPGRWTVIPFGGEEPFNFLRRIDFWVYMHHPDLREAFGRAAMEALAAGCVAILPPYMKELFGDAALYAEPSEVLKLVDDHWRSPEKYLKQSRRAQEFARGFSPDMHLRRLHKLGVELPAAPAAEPRDLSRRPCAAVPTVVLCLSTADLKLSRGIAQHLRRSGAPVVVAMFSDHPAEVALDEGEIHVPSAASFNIPEEAGDAARRRYVVRRLGLLLGSAEARRVVTVSGEVPEPVMEALEGRAIEHHWVRPDDGAPLDVQLAVRMSGVSAVDAETTQEDVAVKILEESALWA
ncbi:glycosyltransferase [Nesterenkonia xinjiangensis]|uniref:Glycosyl transferases group 1 n=1 Tax=Nesterenkonia xinjiangensis TaxID=225327 RepID=A0A7Z0K7Y6_9MICC|nr:glycosyltransferase [Nesterenkonia xinjiangensis]NYJ77014.1 hypothetical protein [Nesterenkonia xinjiangensis]